MTGLQFPSGNPFRFGPPDYAEKRLENAYYKDYIQKVATSDIITFQVVYENGLFNGVGAVLVNEETGQEITSGRNYIATTINDNRIVNTSFTLTGVPEAVYRIRVTAIGNDRSETYESNPLCMKNEHPDTILLVYRNSENANYVYWEGTFRNDYFSIRIEGDDTYGPEQNQSESTIYQEDWGKFKILQDVPYSLQPVNFGGSTGAPDWLRKKIAFALSCDTLYIDGKGYTKTSESSESINSEDNYNLRSAEYLLARSDNVFTEDMPAILVNGMQQYTVYAPAEGLTETLKIYSDNGFRIASRTSRASITPASGNAGYVDVNLNILSNPDTEPWDFEFIITDRIGNIAKVIIIQEAGQAQDDYYILGQGGIPVTINGAKIRI